MPIPFNEQQIVEIIVRGDIAAGGSRTVPTWNTFHFRRTAGGVAINKAAVETAFQAAIGVPLGACLNARWTQLFNTCRCINDVNDAVVQVPYAIAGGVAGDSMTTTDQAYMALRTGFRKGNFRGAKRFGPLSEADTTIGSSDILNAAALARFATLATAILAGFNAASGPTWIPCILSRTLSQLKTNPTFVITTDIASILMNKTIKDSRLRKVNSVY